MSSSGPSWVRPVSASDRGGTARHAWQRIRYRVHQVRLELHPAIFSGEAAEVRRRLSDRELLLFLAADPRDRRHSVDLFKRLLHQGTQRGRYPSDAMLVAALLHDVGKGPLRTWHRIAFVLLDTTIPRLLRRLEKQHDAGWRGALGRLRHHAALGAALLREAGADPRVVELVEAHTTAPPEGDDELRWFIEADDRV